MTLSIIGFIFIFNTTIVHPFHVSVCEIYHNEKTKALEITLKIFIDDFEFSIQKRGHADFYMTGKSAEEVEKSPISNYLQDHFSLKLNNKSIVLEFLGFEFQDDAILCYLEGAKIRNIGEIELQNSVLTDVFDDQINLTHFQVKGEMKSVKTTMEKTSASVNF